MVGWELGNLGYGSSVFLFCPFYRPIVMSNSCSNAYNLKYEFSAI
jgi:hypothetical protein